MLRRVLQQRGWRLSLSAAFILSVSPDATSLAFAETLSTAKLERLSSFCAADGAFGQKFGVEAVTTNPEPEKTSFVTLYQVHSQPEWAPFNKIQVQRTRSKLTFRIYGTALFSTLTEARVTLNSLALAIKEKGFSVETYPDAFAFTSRSASRFNGYQGAVEIEGRKLLARCSDNGLVERALQEGPS